MYATVQKRLNFRLLKADYGQRESDHSQHFFGMVAQHNLKVAPSSGERGVSMVEFLLVFPFVFIILVGAIEFAHQMRIKESLTSLGREAGQEAFRRCANGMSNQSCGKSGGETQTTSCLRNWVAEPIAALSTALRGGMMVRLSVYAYDADTGEPFLAGVIPAETDPPGTKFTLDDFDSTPSAGPPGRFAPLLQAHGQLVISEVWYLYSPIIPILSPMNQWMYNASIY